MPERVLVAMSGGVDSSVALLKVIEMGFEPIGITMKLWENKNFEGSQFKDSTCCGIEEINGAKLVCNQLGVIHYTLDFTEAFISQVVDNFVDEYLDGRTPNPCVRCNSFVKWDAFLDQADEFGAKYIATGHYAQIENNNGNYLLQKGTDPNKDQSYVLWGIPQKTLSRTLFPIGNLNKKQVREIAEDNNLATAKSPESMEICFVADNNYKKFMKKYTPKRMIGVEGNIIQEGQIVGKHSGYTNYTIGQRKGIGVTYPEARYVKSIDSTNNTITITKKEGLYHHRCRISDINWLIETPKFPLEVELKIRYNSASVKGKILSDEKGPIATFDEPQLSVTPGQSIVFYKKNQVLGGGIIEKN